MSLEDDAQQYEAKLWELRNINRKELPALKKPGEPGYGPEECDECGDTMPEVRRANGYLLCTACKSAIERLSGRR